MNTSEPLHNPFVGLRPFESTDSLYYFGRNEQIKALLQHLHATRFLAVVGSSGSGKSSLIRAGLIPNLEAGFLVQDRDLWQIAVMKPGDTPLHNFAREILKALGVSTTAPEVTAFADSIGRTGIEAVLATVRPVLDKLDANLLLLVDQFEELFRFSHLRGRAGREEAADFVGLMLQLAAQTTVPIYVCMTMRSDFLGECDTFYSLPEAMNRSQYLVPRLTRQQRREVIAGPICLAGASITPRLQDRLLNESVDTRDDLPILQHALMRTWRVWATNGQGPIDIEHYNDIGTVKQALNGHAEEALQELSGPEKLIAQRLFQTLADTDTSNRRIRRPAHLNEIAAISGATPEHVMQVIHKFRQDDRNFLILSSEDVADDPLVEISHESLIRQWQTLSDWVDEEAESAKIYRRLAETAGLHAQGRAGFYRDADLQVALHWHKERQPTGVWGKRYHEGFEQAITFLDESQHARDQARTIKIRILATIATVIVIVLLCVSYLALKLNEAKDNAQRQLARNYWDNGRQAREAGNHGMAKHFMAAAIEATPDLAAARSIVQDLSADLYIRTDLILQHQGSVWGALFSRDESRILTWSEDKTAQVWDTATGKPLGPALQHQGSVWGALFSRDESRILTWSQDKTAQVWDTATGKPLGPALQHQDSVWGALFSRDESRILTWSGDKTARVWEISGDVDFPKDKTVLQIEALSGTKFNPITHGLEIMPAHEFNDAKEKYLQIAREHARTCQYPRHNIYLHFWGDKNRAHTR